jgi:hypothetical protein
MPTEKERIKIQSHTKKIQIRRDNFSKKKKPYFWGYHMREERYGKRWVIHGKNDFREYAGRDQK